MSAIRSEVAGRQASRWFARLKSQKIDGSTDDAFRRWLELAPQHEEEFERRELAWELAGELEHDPEIVAQLQALEGNSAKRQPGHRRRNYVAAALTAGIAVAAVITWRASDFGAQEFATRVGEQRRIALSDGSRVILNTNSALRVAFGRDTRRVLLERGEATFEVARDPARPFAVLARGGIATAVGTRYNVLDTGNQVEVTVLEGRVQVGADGQRDRSGPVLSAGEAVTLRRDGSTGTVRTADVRRIRAWHEERLEFDGLTLERAVAETNRYSDTKLRIADPSIADIEISGVFRAGDVTGFVAALNAAFGIRAIGGDSEILLMPALKRSRGHAGLDPLAADPPGS